MTSQTTSPTNSGDMLCVYTTVVQLTVITINHPLIATISKEMHAIDRFLTLLTEYNYFRINFSSCLAEVARLTVHPAWL